MPTTLYDATVLTYRQILAAVAGYLDKAKSHCEQHDIPLDEVVEKRLFDDMLPFHFQMVSVAHHSQGAIEGVRSGVFEPPGRSEAADFGVLQTLIADASSWMAQVTPDDLDAIAGNDVEFRLGERRIPFTAPDFLLSFSLPNFYFHATTGYDILRSLGVPLGKRDFLGRMRLKT